MPNKLLKSSTMLFLLKCLLSSYVLTGGLLLLLALLLYRFQLPEAAVSISIIGIYLATTFTAGFIAGKRMGTRKYIWGLVVGLLYFIILLLVSLIVNKTLQGMGTHFITTLFLCGGSGMLGGMLS